MVLWTAGKTKRCRESPKGAQNRADPKETDSRFVPYFFLTATFLISVVALLASASFSKPATAENFLPIA